MKNDFHHVVIDLYETKAYKYCGHSRFDATRYEQTEMLSMAKLSGMYYDNDRFVGYNYETDDVGKFIKFRPCKI